MKNIDIFKKYTACNYMSFENFRVAKLYRDFDAFKSINLDLFWNELSKYRKDAAKFLSFIDKDGNNFFYNYTSESSKYINHIEDLGRDKVEDIIPDDFKEGAYIDALIEEAFSSSVMEGAFLTQKRAEDMIKNNKMPINKSEKMIFNNYKALEYVVDNADKEITHEIIYNICNILIGDTCEIEDICDGYRNDDVFIKYSNDDNIFEGHSSNVVFDKMDDLIKYYNEIDNTNPVLKACIIHYYFVDLHPFFDGNGRLARVLMYMYLIRNGYDFLKYFSISKILVGKRKQYYDAFKNCQTHENDLTYFIDFYTKLLIDSIIYTRRNYLNQFGENLIFESIEFKDVFINFRQEEVIRHFLKRTKSGIDISEYTKTYEVTIETARKDLQILVDYGFLDKIKVGKKFQYNFNDIGEILDRLGDM